MVLPFKMFIVLAKFFTLYVYVLYGCIFFLGISVLIYNSVVNLGVFEMCYRKWSIETYFK